MHPENEAWENLIRECWPEAEPTTRYAIRRCKDFDREKLQSFVDALPEGYEIKRIDNKIYLKKVWIKDGDLYGLARNDPEEDYFAFKLLPIGENTFGRASGSVKITFGDNCLVIDGITCRKL